MFLASMKCLVIVLVVWLCLGSDLATAGETVSVGQAALPATFIHDLAGNRDRIIQLTMVAVAIGIVILMWK